MRSASTGATLKHNPGTETRARRRGRPLIINHVGHYLAASLSLLLSLSRTHTHAQLRAHSLPVTFFRCFYQTGKLFIVSVIIPLSLLTTSLVSL